MKDLKIRVADEAESKEAQELFFELGYSWSDGKDIFDFDMPEYIVNWNNGYITVGDDFDKNRQEITLPELRDLVVLKRNSIDDATHKGSITDNVYYVSSDEEVYRFESSAWCFSTVPIAYLKPIEKPMKEYLRKNNDGEYILEVTDEREAQEPHAKHWIEIPGGVNFYYSFASGDKVFTKEQSSLGRLLWQRKPPFSINDQYAEIEKVRQSHRTASETADPTIKETLSQRQEQYGSFEDVAMLTEQMVDVMRKGYYEKLAYNQKMALYMICSKMARIVNGNPNHKDSWHDIAGYATLIDNELVSEKDMPF